MTPPVKRRQGQRGKDKRPRKVTHTAKGKFPEPPPHEPSPDITHPKKRAFLAAYARLGNISSAAHAVGIGRKCHSDWMDKDPAYVPAFRSAEEAAGDYLEALALFRAQHGSDVLTIFLLKGNKPRKYRERLAITGEDGGPLKAETRVVLTWGHPDAPPKPDDK